MSDSNPYAPPAVADLEAASGLTWQVQGNALLVKNGAVLPQIDLETGEHAPEMMCALRVLETAGSMLFLRFFILAGICIFLTGFIKLGVAATIGIAAALSLIFQLAALRGPSNERIVISEFFGDHRLKARGTRRKWRFIAIGIICAVMMANPFLISRFNPDYTEIVVGVFGGGVVLLIGIAIWAVLDRSSAKSMAGPPGWMRIAPVHPQALAFLNDLQNEARLQAAALPASRKRLIRTTYYHRYPLRLLLGKNLTKPLLLIRIVLMKFLRSRHLERETYHYSEALTVPADQLCPQILTAINSWLAAHPDWSFVTGEQSTSPAGDLHLHSAILAAPGLDHSACVVHAWATLKPKAGTTQSSFGSWLADGTFIRTNDHPYLPHRNPRVRDFRASGTPDQVFQAHLQHCAGQAISPSRDPQELLARVQQEKEETDQLLTAMGYQSEVREVG